MTDELPSLKAAEYIKPIIGEYGQAQGRDVLEEMACAYLVWLGAEHGREAIDGLIRDRIDRSLQKRTNNQKGIRLVWSKPAPMGMAQ